MVGVPSTPSKGIVEVVDGGIDAQGVDWSRLLLPGCLCGTEPTSSYFLRLGRKLSNGVLYLSKNISLLPPINYSQARPSHLWPELDP